jgi:hypothetical protein
MPVTWLSSKFILLVKITGTYFGQDQIALF